MSWVHGAGRLRLAATVLGRSRIPRAAASSTASATTDVRNKDEPKSAQTTVGAESSPPASKKVAESDEEIRQAMERMAGDGGDAGLELEDGKPVTMKRGVRENMFRYI